MANRRWLIPLSLLTGVALYGAIRSGQLRRFTSGGEQFSESVAAPYDILSRVLMGDFYDRAARDMAAACPEGDVLDAGCGTGHLAIRLAQLAPELQVTGLDISSPMIDRANHNAALLGLKDRLHFQPGDVEDMPFPNERFDLVVSTLSLHHWANPSKGLAEIYRVLKPGGQARIYDLPDWVRRYIHSQGNGRSLAQLATESPFGTGVVAVYRWPWRVPSLRCLWLRRESSQDTNQ